MVESNYGEMVETKIQPIFRSNLVINNKLSNHRESEVFFSNERT